jgi:hypothetical protein
MRFAMALLLVLGACSKQGGAEKQQLAFRKTAVQIHLKNLTNRLEQYYAEMAAFPAGKAGPTPSESCCKAPDRKCPASEEWSADPVWQKVHYEVAEPGYFQYAYEGSADGKAATLTATADLDCDGTPITYRVVVTAGPNGANVATEQPAPDAF